MPLPLPGAGTRPQGAAFTLEQVRALPNEQAAVEMSIRCSGLLSKDIQLALGFDKGHWSRIESGEVSFPFRKVNQFMDVVGNEILLIYSTERRGYDWSTLRQHINGVEAENEALKGEVADLRRALALVLDMKQGARR